MRETKSWLQRVSGFGSFFFVFGFAQLSDNLKLIGFHVCQNVQDLSLFPAHSIYLSLCVCVCLLLRRSSPKRREQKGKRAANWSASRALAQLLLAYPVCGFSRKMKSFESVCWPGPAPQSLPQPACCCR